jgi:hypothetical protein
VEVGQEDQTMERNDLQLIPVEEGAPSLTLPAIEKVGVLSLTLPTVEGGGRSLTLLPFEEGGGGGPSFSLPPVEEGSVWRNLPCPS